MGDKTYPLDDNYSKEQTVRVNVGSTKVITPELVIDEIEKKCGVGSVLACVPKNDNNYEVVMRERRNVGEISGDGLFIQGKSISVNELVSVFRIVSIFNMSMYVTDEEIIDRFDRMGVEIVTDIRKRKMSSRSNVYDDCPEFKCFKCGQQGHISKNCLENKCKSCLRPYSDCDCLTRKRYFGEGFGHIPEGKRKTPWGRVSDHKRKYQEIITSSEENNTELKESENDLISGNTLDVGPSVISSEQGTSDDVKKSKVVKVVADVHTSDIMCDDIEANGEDWNGDDVNRNGNGNGDGAIGDGIGNGDEDDDDEYTDADEAMADDVTATVDNASENGEKTKIATDNSEQTKIATDNGVKTKIATEMTNKDSEQISEGHIVTVNSNISKCNVLLSTNEIMNENVSCETIVNDEKISNIPSLEQKCSQGGDDGVFGELDEISMDTDPLTDEESEWASVEDKCKNIFKKNARRKSLKVKVNVKAAMLAHQKKKIETNKNGL
ncbi:Hypothetical predicted protein [Mytilus galloprovincialis]|uniref:CCHC-type domain-containing protein n=1 Tax=Mytilus galloprovincialis TaxID=29158 RepID=A0A8B6HS47_MYTGA|nr:Hypothetical predicted protein [Mytilus galloprovincialis]